MSDAKTINGKHVLMALIAFFGVIIVANVIFVTLALRSFPGEAEKKSYMQGLQYNKTLEERAAQAALGWRAEITEVSRSNEVGVIKLAIVDRTDQVVRGLTVSGALKRPTHQDDDIEITFLQTERGGYRVEIEGLSPGVWDMTVKAENMAGQEFDINARVVVQ